MTPTEIKAVRENLGLTQQSLADSLNVKVDTVRSWEGGRRNPDGAAVRLLELLRDGKIQN